MPRKKSQTKQYTCSRGASSKLVQVLGWQMVWLVHCGDNRGQRLGKPLIRPFLRPAPRSFVPVPLALAGKTRPLPLCPSTMPTASVDIARNTRVFVAPTP